MNDCELELKMDNEAQANKLVTIKGIEKSHNALGEYKVNQATKMSSVGLRNFIGFWLLGLSNNFAYVVMLSAAHDILEDKKPDSKEICNAISTGVILLLDIVPSLIVKLFAPFILGHTSIKVLISVVLTIASFLLTGLEFSQTMAFIGVALASFASGLGEVSFLGWMSKFEANSISAWSSGTGAAGFFGALSYFGLTFIGLTSKQSILVMLIIPFIMLFAYFWLIVEEDEAMNPLLNASIQPIETDQNVHITLSTKFKIFRSLLKYMIPIGLIYSFEYFINQGLSELVYFKNSEFNHKQQYRFYQAEYQFGVLISRSSINLIRIDKIWILAVLQGVNVLIFIAHILHPFLSAFWIASCVVLFEGFLGGAGYVNTFYKLKKTDEIAVNHKEFAMSVTSLADTLGITVSAFLAIPAHNILCAYMKRHY